MKKLSIVFLVLTLLVSMMLPAMAEAGDVKIGWYAPGSNQYTDAVGKAVEKFAADYGADVRIIFGDGEQATMDAQIRAMVADGYTNISSFPATEGAAGLYDELAFQGVKCVTYGASTAPQTELLCAASNVKQAAYTATEAVIEAMGGSGKILNVLEVLTDSNTAKRREGVIECVEAHDGVEIAMEIADINSIEEGVTKISSAMGAVGSEINGIVCTGTQTSSAVVQVMSDYYARNPEADPIFVVCCDCADDVMKGIEDGIIYGTMAQNVDAHGYLSCALLYYMATENMVPAEGQFLVDTGVVLVTKDNLDTYNDDLTALTEKLASELTTTYLTAE